MTFQIFFEDICTINELLSLSQRFEVASMLREKKTYLEIAEQTGASTATISRVNRSLNYGNDGYDMVLDRMKKSKSKSMCVLNSFISCFSLFPLAPHPDMTTSDMTTNIHIYFLN